MMSEQLAGKIALVTGGANGIGQSIVERFAKEGAQVIAADIASPNTATPFAAAQFVQCDVRQPESVARVIQQALDTFGRIDILINNAGRTGGTGHFLDVTAADWHDYIETNLTGVFLVGQAAARTMVHNQIRGRIINIGSINSFAAEKGATAYVASKGGVLSLTQAMAVELAEYGILVNMIAPGPIRVARNAALFDSEPLHGGLQRRIPLGSPGRGNDIAVAAVFLASDDNQFITGASLLVDGGLTALLSYD